jgi:exopolysaccharide production protein ExoZ
VKRLAWIDALRGYAIIGVLAVHVGGVADGARGVQLFFMASAIALLHSWHGQKDSVRRFYTRRLFRIAPMFWLAIPTFFWLSTLTHAEHISLSQIISATLFLHWATPNWQNAAVPGSWSIGCEVLFYAIFPLLAARIDSLEKSIVAAGVATISAALAWPCLVAYAAAMGVDVATERNSFAFTSITTQLPCFMTGFCVYYAVHREWSKRWIRLGAAVGLSFFLVIFILRPQSSAFYLAYCIAFALIANAMANGQLRALANRAVVGLGVISYSAYFWHFFWIEFLRWEAPTAAGRLSWSLAVIGLTIAASAITYRFVEWPGIRLGAILARSQSEIGSAKHQPNKVQR